MKVKYEIPLMRPILPAAGSLRQYLESIDESRVYTNQGPLLARFEAALCAHFQAPVGQIACVSSGTLGLILALKALDPPPGGHCIMPSWTFVATPCAAVSAGLVPYFADVSEDTWALDPEGVKAELRQVPGPVAAVAVVSAFGAPVDHAAWNAFHDETGIPVVFDMAAGFDTCSAGQVPSVVSLHATKVFGVGEGGFVTGSDQGLIDRVRRDSNYGFVPPARLMTTGLNAKMSEYAAAVGLAMMDEWKDRRVRYLEKMNRYVEGIRDIPDCTLSPGFGGTWCSSTFNVRISSLDVDLVQDRLRKSGIETRQWWGKGCHRQPAFAGHPAGNLAITERLASSVLGLPFYLDLPSAQIDYICNCLSDLIRNEAGR